MESQSVETSSSGAQVRPQEWQPRIVAFLCNLVAARWLGTLLEQLRRCLTPQLTPRIVGKDLAMVRIEKRTVDQAVTVHQKVKADVAIRRVDLDESLALAEVTTRLGCVGDAGAGAHQRSDGCRQH